MRVAVIGANGQLGTDVCAAFRRQGDTVLELNHADMEISEEGSVRSVLEGAGPDLVVNTSAMHHVDRCEEDPAGSFAVNAGGARNLAVFSRDSGTPLLHVSTDYVFDGARQAPYDESDLPIPLNVYGITKLAGEHMIRATTETHFILRTSGLYGRTPCRAKGCNFVELMLKLAVERGHLRVVDDEVLTPTSTEALASMIVKVSTSGRYGLYHATAEGSCSWHAFAARIFELAKVDVRLEVAAPGEFPNKTPRPSYSVLSGEKLRDAGFGTLGTWEEGLADYLEARAERLQAAS